MSNKDKAFNSAYYYLSSGIPVSDMRTPDPVNPPIPPGPVLETKEYSFSLDVSSVSEENKPEYFTVNALRNYNVVDTKKALKDDNYLARFTLQISKDDIITFTVNPVEGLDFEYSVDGNGNPTISVEPITPPEPKKYTVSYTYTNQPPLYNFVIPSQTEHLPGDIVDISELYSTGEQFFVDEYVYTFTDYSISQVDITNNQFVMPENDVEVVGVFTKEADTTIRFTFHPTSVEIRANSIPVEIKNGDTTVDTVTITKANNWSETSNRLPKGLNYTIPEVIIEGFAYVFEKSETVENQWNFYEA